MEQPPSHDSDSWRMPLAWSIPGVPILAIWSIGLLGANATGFVTEYSLVGVLKAIAAQWPKVILPDEFGGMLQFSPVLAFCIWLLCLIPYRMDRQVIPVIIAGMVIPTIAYIFSQPVMFIFGPILSLVCLVGVTTGEEWQDGFVAFGGAATWWWFMFFLLLMTIYNGRGQSRIRRGLCPKCAYPVGASDVCTECGAPVAARITVSTASG